jgi:hypothetical protein
MPKELRTSGSKEGIIPQIIQRYINVIPLMSFEIYFDLGTETSMNRKIVNYCNMFVGISEHKVTQNIK